MDVMGGGALLQWACFLPSPIFPFLGYDQNFIRKACFSHVKPVRSTKAFLHMGNMETEAIFSANITLKGQHKITG